MQRINKIIAVLICMCIVFGFAGCAENKEKPEETEKLSIVCTLFPQYDFVREIAGDKADITLLLTPGTDSHSYDPSPLDMVKINESDLFIYTGDMMESWAADIVAGLDEKVAVLNVSEGLSLSADENGHEHTEEKEHDHSADPHIWTSPVNAMRIVHIICENLCEIDPENAEYYKTNEEIYLGKLELLDTNLAEITASARMKTIVVCDRFAMLYFCEEYNLDYIAAFDACTSNTEPSPAVIVKIANEVKEKNIPVVFAAELSNRKVADAVAAQTGAKVLELHSCHNLSSDDFNAGETYLSLMQRNAENLKIALGTE